MLCAGWLLVFFGPGHRLRNTYNVQYYVPLFKRNFLDILRTTSAWFSIYFAASLPLTIPSFLALLDIKKYQPQKKQLYYSILVFLLLGFSTALLFALMLQWLLPPRAWIYVFLFLLCIFHLTEIIKYRNKFSPIFTEIQIQKKQGIKNIIIETDKYTLRDAFFLRWVDDFFVQPWVLDGMARYYKVDSINFIDPYTKKSYR